MLRNKRLVSSAVFQHPLQHRITPRPVVVPRRNDLLVRADKVLATLHELVELYRITNGPLGIGQLHLAGFLVAVGLLADLLSDQNRVCLVAEMRGVRHGSGEGIGADEYEEMPFTVDIGEVTNGMHQIFESLVVVAASVKTQIDDEFVGVLLLDQVEKPFECLPRSLYARKLQ